ncbi:MAG: phosphatase [Oscillospiraceae bacterium]|jgi:putative hydrolase|nr:phosphatase [Oscillospiraceae bacterium]
MKIIADTHTHTVACDHAYSTFSENAARAKTAGLDFICATEHASAMKGAPGPVYFSTLHNLPRVLDGVTIIRGAELNILDYEGGVDLTEGVLKNLEWVIASYHSVCIEPADIAAHTRGWINIAANPLIHVIGHCGDSRYNFEHKPVLEAFKTAGKIVEINNHSFHVRPGTHENCKKIAIACAEYGVPIVVSSDAHHATHIGELGDAIAMLGEIGFPEELVLNADSTRFLSAVSRVSGKRVTP